MNDRPEDENADNDARLLDVIDTAALANIEEQIAELAEQAATGADDVTEKLAAIVEALPESVRVEIIRKFQELSEEWRQSRGVDEEELTPEMEAQKRLIEEREHMLMAHWLSQETLKKIRRALLVNPTIFQQLINIGEELTKRGVFYDTRRTQVTGADLGTVSLQADLATNKDREKDTGQSR